MASVLKHQRLVEQGEVPRPVAFNIEDVQEKAKGYLEQMQSQAEKILANARVEAERIKEQAHQAGLAEAKKQYEEELQRAAQTLSDERCRTAIQSCEATVNALVDATTNWLDIWRNETVHLAGRMAEKVARQKLGDNQELLRGWLEEAIVALRDARQLRVLVHPDDFAVAGRFLSSLAKTVPQAANVEVVPDPEISLGGCVVRSEHGLIDQQLESQIARLVEQLK